MRPAADRMNPKKFYVYDTADGKIYVSTDGATNFEQTASGLAELPDYARTSGSIEAMPGVGGQAEIVQDLRARDVPRLEASMQVAERRKDEGEDVVRRVVLAALEEEAELVERLAEGEATLRREDEVVQADFFAVLAEVLPQERAPEGEQE